MACRDCIHCRACHEMYLLVVSQEDDFFERHDAETCEDFKNKADFVNVWKIKEKIIDLYNDKSVLKMDKIDRLNFRKGLVAVDKILTEMARGKTG